MAQKYRVYNQGKGKFSVADDDDPDIRTLVEPGRRKIMSARQLVRLQKSALFKTGNITYERVGVEETEISELLALDVKTLRTRLRSIDDEALLQELLVAAHEQPAAKNITDAITKRLDDLDEEDLTPDEAPA